MTHSINKADNGQTFITVFADGQLVSADDTHPNFKAIIGACHAAELGEDTATDQEILDLFDVAAVVQRKFARLSERVTVSNGQIEFDGDPCQPALSKQILNFMDNGLDFEPLVNFMDKIMSNPEPHSREQAFEWLNNHDFTITSDGDVIAYKGVYPDGHGGYQSGWAGTAVVNDVTHTGKIPYAIGDVVTMPRSAVMHDPAAACTAGLHVGTHSYASGYARGAMLKVLVNPRDIVSVPTDAHGEKIRVCRFEILDFIENEIKSPLDGFTVADFEDEDTDDATHFVDGDEVVCTYFDYGYGTVEAVDEDGDLWVKFDTGRTLCMGSTDVEYA